MTAEDINFRKIDGGYAFSAIVAGRLAAGYVRRSMGKGWEATTRKTDCYPHRPRDVVDPVCRWGGTRKAAVRSSARAAHYGGDWWPISTYPPSGIVIDPGL